MGQILHGSATTTHATRAAIQRSKASLKKLAAQHGLNQKPVAKWRKRAFVHNAPMGPKTVRSRPQKRRWSSPSASTRCCLWMTVSTHCRQRSAACSATGSAACPRSPATSQPGNPSSATPLATSTSTSPRFDRGRQTLSLRGGGPDRQVCLCMAGEKGHGRRGQSPPRRVGGSCPLPDPHCTDRQQGERIRRGVRSCQRTKVASFQYRNADRA
ncbi:hypothetical protein CI1B_25880 [Bradyrhizobium ivorense]|uniref:Uncharacterized protein n=1 Tax=Bradyrhizobium ivorense TaxID=2511166 RepID=A0A508T4A2_9BRAD|nr:hypothetical protein CI1B_25880 [Bradyrhizobium ivorense]